MDINYLLYLQQIRTATGGIFDSLILALTTLGEASISWGLLALVYWCVDKRAGQLMALNVSFASTINQGLKNILKIERPWVQDSRIVPVEKALSHAGGYSFPSGHTTRATAVWGALGKALWQKKEKVLAGISIAACFLVAFTRNYLGVHTVKDVFVALVMGFALILVLDYALVWVEKGKNRDLVVVAAGCVIFLGFMLKVGCLSNAGAGVGILFGWMIERRYIKFDTKGSFLEKACRFVIGAFLLVFLYTVPNSILVKFMAGKYAGFFSNFLFSIVLMAVYPFLFSKFREQRKTEKNVLLMILGTIALISLVGTGIVNGKIKKEAAESIANEVTQVEADTVQKERAEEVNVVEEATPSPKKIEVIAHRGYSSEFPENTMAAFKGACELGVDYIELDVQLSKDGVPVLFHDTDMKRLTGQKGLISDYTYEELWAFDVGSWFHSGFAGERIPTLQMALEYIATQECKVYLELKDCGPVPGFEDSVVEVVQSTGMQDRVVYASFNYEYLKKIKELDNNSKILYNTTSDKKTIVQEYPAEFYGLYFEAATADLIEAIHAEGKMAFAWTVTTPEEMTNLIEMGIDGIVTNDPGRAKVVIRPEYSFLVDEYIKSFTMPGFYETWLPERCKNVVVQGFTKSPQYMFISAYSKTGDTSILFVMNLNGDLINIVDLQFEAHTGGISYDSVHNYLWVTGPNGLVYAISYDEVINGTYSGNILVQFDAGLVNHNGGKVASFLTWFENELYVGSYVDGANGLLNKYDLSEVNAPKLLSQVQIPERIQGMTFWRNANKDSVTMYLSQGYQTLDGGLLCFDYNDETVSYDNPREAYVLPEGIEQIQATAHGMYLLFESAAWPYRPTARIVNDQIYLIQVP